MSATTRTTTTSTATDVRAAGRIADALALIGRHWHGTADPGRVVASTTHAAYASKPPLPAAVLSLRREVLDVLTMLAIVVCDERDLRGPRHEVLALVQWLGRHADWLGSTAQPDDPTATVHELEQLASRVREVALQQQPAVVDVGPCPLDDVDEAGAHCDGQLRATVRRTDDLLPSVIRCTRRPNEHTWAPRQWEHLAAQCADVIAVRAYLPVVDAASVAGVPARTIRAWVAAGKVQKWPRSLPALVSVLEVVAVRDGVSDLRQEGSAVTVCSDTRSVAHEVPA